jgi:hypothetical protein
VQEGTSQAEMEVELEVLPTDAGAEVGGEPTAVADAGVGTAAVAGVGRWSCGGTPSGTSEEHYWTELPQPSSSCFPCGRRLRCPRSRHC